MNIATSQCSYLKSRNLPLSPLSFTTHFGHPTITWNHNVLTHRLMRLRRGPDRSPRRTWSGCYVPLQRLLEKCRFSLPTGQLPPYSFPERSLTTQQSAKFPKSNVKVTKGEESIGTYTSNKTTSGKPKDKVFTKCCGCTLWTIPMLLGGNNYIIRTAILENG